MQEHPTNLREILVEAKSYLEDLAKLYDQCPRAVVFRLTEGRYRVLHSSEPVLFDKDKSPYPTTRFYSFSSQIELNGISCEIRDVEKFFFFLRFEFLAQELKALKTDDFVAAVSDRIASSSDKIGLSII